MNTISTNDNATNMVAKLNENFNELNGSLTNDKKVADLFQSLANAKKLMWFSDIHGDSDRLERIVAFKEKYNDYLNDAICTGDMCWHDFSTAEGNFTFWGEAGADSILMAIGNHDAYATYPYTSKLTESNQFTKTFAPYIADWGVTYQDGKCYYYKDYDDVRMIVLDVMHMGTEQLTWLKTQLADSITNEKQVIIAAHFSAFRGTYCGRKFDQKFAMPTTGMTTSGDFYHFGCCLDYQYLLSDTNVKSSVADNYYLTNGDGSKSGINEMVQGFIDDGGVFICYISGHHHADYARFHPRYPKQFNIGIASAGKPWKEYNGKMKPTCSFPRAVGYSNEDLFDIIAIDSSNKIVSFIRYGADRDRSGRISDTLSYDYGNNIIIGESILN